MNKQLNQEIKKQLGFLDPMKVFNQWLKKAVAFSLPDQKNSWSMTVSSSYKNKVSSRIVLLKKFEEDKLIFYSNYLSDKGREFQLNPQTAVNFYWPQLKKQVRITGRITKTSPLQSDKYWKSRDRNSQISQWLSRQSKELTSRKELLNLKKQTEKKFKNRAIPRPKHWGGYQIKIKTIEFWLDGPYRLHDRFLFKKTGKVWKAKRLFP